MKKIFENFLLRIFRWTDGYLFRFLQANKFKNEATAPCIVEHTKWRKASLPSKLDDNITKILVGF